MTRRAAILGAATAAASAWLWYAAPDTPPTAVTDEHGRYTLTVPNPPGCEDSTLTLTYPPAGRAVSSLDAAYILDAAVGNREVDARACDVTGDGTCSAADAAAVLAYQVGREGAYSTGEWRPTEVPVTLCPGQATTADVTAYVLGDVTANWGPEP